MLPQLQENTAVQKFAEVKVIKRRGVRRKHSQKKHREQGKDKLAKGNRNRINSKMERDGKS